MRAKLAHHIAVGFVLSAASIAPAFTARITRDLPSRAQTQAAQSSAAHRTDAVEFHDAWRKLWEDHITWTRMVIIGVFDDLTCTPEYTARLLQNYEDMEDALAPYYGDDAETLGDLIQDHLLIAAELLAAAKAGDTAAFEDARDRWYANGREIADFMAEINPRYWPLSEGEDMWVEHLDATLAEAVAHLSNDCAGDVRAYDLVHELALEMADFFSDGIIQQFSTRFGNRNAVIHK
jgi:hypothetical protein